MIDFHSHILPKVDDGSKSRKESLALLDMLSEQGVRKVVATPHFLADEESVEAFLKRRNSSFAALKEIFRGNEPEIILGAEVAYYDGISQLEGLEKLCAGKSNLLLIEMPMNSWSEYALRELFYLAQSTQLQPVLAHVERYLPFQERGIIKRLSENGVMLQSNASFFNNRIRSNKALKLLYGGYIQFIGSDCHNIDTRPPQLGLTEEKIVKKFGKGFMEETDRFIEDLLSRERY